MTTLPNTVYSLSGQLASFVVAARAEAMPKATMEMARLCILDWLGSALAGSREKPGKIVLELIKEMGGEPQATLIPTGEKTSVLNAALVNGAVSHIVELDDLHRGAILHPAAPIVPAALAIAEMLAKSGEELLLAVIVGYEVAIRIGEAVTPSHYHYWHTTATCGTFGAAAAAGKLLGLTQEEMVHALGTAGTQAAGLWEFINDGAMSKHLHPGKAAQNGVLAAMLARKGFTAAKKILEGERGFFKAMASEVHAEKIYQGLGVDYKIMGNSFKVYASCRHTHPAIDLMIDWYSKNGVNLDAIRRILIETYQIALDIAGYSDPKSIYEAKFSLPFCVALAGVKGSAKLEDFNVENLSDPLIRQVMAKIELQAAEDLNSRYPEQWPARISIETQSGEVFRLATNYPKGDPENMVEVGELQEKFYQLAIPSVGKLKADNLTGLLSELGEIVDINSLTGSLKS